MPTPGQASRETLIDFFRDLDSHPRRVSRLRRRLSAPTAQLRRCRTRAARGFAARLARRRRRARATRSCCGARTAPSGWSCYWGCLLAGVIVVPIDYRSSAGVSSSKVRGDRRGARSCSSATTCRRRPVGRRPRHRRARSGASPISTGPPTARCRRWTISRDDVIADHLHVGRDGRAEGRRDPASQRARQHRPGRARGAQVPEVRAAVPCRSAS